MASSLRLTRPTNSNQRATSGVGLPCTMSDPCRRSFSVLCDQTTVPCNNNLQLSHSNNLVQQFVQHLASLISGQKKVHSTKRNTCTVGTIRFCREKGSNPHTTTATIFAQTADAATADPHRVLAIRKLFECCDPCTSVSHPIANSLRKCGFLIPPQRMWMFLGIRL